MGATTKTWTIGALAAILAFTGCSSDDNAGGGSGDTTASTAASNESSTTTEAEAAAETGEFTLLSYNVAGLPVEISKESPDVNIPLISPRLEPYDIVITQEDFDWWSGFAGALDFVNYHTRLRAGTTHEYSTEAHPGPEAVGLDTTTRMYPLVGDGLGVLSRLPIAKTVRVPWTDCFGGLDTSDRGAADCASMKGFLFTEVTLPNGAVFHLYNLHAEAGGSERDQELQVADYEQLAAFITENSAGVAVVLGGDTNLHTESDHEDGASGADTEIWQRFLDATGLTDACAATSCERVADIDKAAVRGSDAVDLEVVSHAFVSDDFLDAAGEDLSDHPPLAVTIRWTAK